MKKASIIWTLQFAILLISSSVLWISDGYTLGFYPKLKPPRAHHHPQQSIRCRQTIPFVGRRNACHYHDVLYMAPTSDGGTNQTVLSSSSSATLLPETDTDTDTTSGHQSNNNIQVNGVASNNGATSNGTPLPPWLNDLVEKDNVAGDEDVPRPTANGGYSHTSASKAKISAANKGKVPWNKGKGRSEETKARIAAGVRKKNRERFLQKLADQGITEEEYNAQEAAKKAKKEAERQARRTEKGGYRLTEETKQKISRVLKTKWANGEVKKRSIDPTKVRRGFTHSAETRAKISESLRKRWANDEEYRENMVNKTTAANSRSEVRQRIANTLKKKWEDPIFRATMTAKMAQRKKPAYSPGMSHREKISKAMKAKWQNEEYRKKATEGMAKRQAELAKTRPPRVKKPRPKRKPTPKPPKPAVAKLAQPMSSPKPKKLKGVRKKRATVTAITPDGDMDGAPLLATPPVQAQVRAKATKKTKEAQTAPKDNMVDPDIDPVAATSDSVKQNEDADMPKAKAKRKRRKREKPGSVTRLREERRDLYDLLYGDEEDDPVEAEDRGSVLPSTPELPKSKLASLFFEDENLDDFDPYGLEEG